METIFQHLPVDNYRTLRATSLLRTGIWKPVHSEAEVSFVTGAVVLQCKQEGHRGDMGRQPSSDCLAAAGS